MKETMMKKRPWAGSPPMKKTIARTATPARRPAKRAKGKVLKCLAVRDPWISRIGKGLKPFELRSKRTHYRGPVVLCSSLKRAKGRGSEHFTDDGPKGMALYTATLVDCREATREDTKKANTIPMPGEFVWILEDVRTLRRPVAVKNWLGLFNAPPALMKHLRAEGVV